MSTLALSITTLDDISPKQPSIATAPNSVYVEQSPIVSGSGPVSVIVGIVVSTTLTVRITCPAEEPLAFVTS